MTKVALYLRVSTKDQTTMNQEIDLKKFCELKGFEIYEIYKDEGISGAKTTRPELDRMLQDMRQRRFDAIVVWKLDRLGRSIQHLLQVLDEMRNKDVKFISTTEGFDTSTPQGELFFSIAGAFAQFERALITERIRAGMERAKSQGKKLGRQAGSKDKTKRMRDGYFSRWKKEKKAKWHKQPSPPKIVVTSPMEEGVK